MQKFDGLADDYDRNRPRYPTSLFHTIKSRLPVRERLRILDAGAGTGIALEGLVDLLGDQHDYLAVDVSADMVEKGREKFSYVEWAVSAAEPYLETLQNVDLVIAAQAYQWMERERFIRGAVSALRAGGVLAIMQNNRDYIASPFLDEYETLLEEHSPGYNRSYRDFDIAAELSIVFINGVGSVQTETSGWSKASTVTEFVRMASSSTQVQRAIEAEGESFLDRVSALVKEHAVNGVLEIAYKSELFLGVLD